MDSEMIDELLKLDKQHKYPGRIKLISTRIVEYQHTLNSFVKITTLGADAVSLAGFHLQLDKSVSTNSYFLRLINHCNNRKPFYQAMREPVP